MSKGERYCVETTIHDDGQSVWVIRADTQIWMSRIERDDPHGNRANAAATAWAENNNLPIKRLEFRRWHAPTIRKLSNDEWHGDAELAKFGIMFEQLLRNGVVEVSRLTGVSTPDPDSNERLQQLYVANLFECSRSHNGYPPPTVLSATLSAPVAGALLEAGAQWVGEPPRDPRLHSGTATMAGLLAELAAGGIVQLRDIVAVSAHEYLEHARRDFRGAYRLSNRSDLSALRDPPLYRRVTIDDARTLIEAGARWVGSSDGDPSGAKNG